MSNPYCTLDQFNLYVDVRTSGQLSRDDKGRQQNEDVLQELLDAHASELESYLDGRYSLPLPTVPPILRKWVAVKTFASAYGRRGNKPAGIAEDVKWADDWTEKLVKGVINVPGIGRATEPVLDSSDYTDGRSRFDALFGIWPTVTSASRGKVV